jgi:uncharacterized protein (TIGR04141 family)
VALNTVDAVKLRSVDAKTIEDLTVHTRRQTSKNAPLGTFALNVSHDLLRAVTGTPKDTSFATRVTGRDSLSITCDATVESLPQKCKELLKAFKGKAYRENFAWVDQLSGVSDPGILAALDKLLVEDLNIRAIERIHMAPPTIIEYEGAPGFHFSGGTRRDRDADIDIAKYLDTREAPLTPEMLDKDSVAVYEGDSIHPKTRWTVKECLVAEVQHAGGTYVLSGGEWFEVAKELAQSVAQQLAGIPDAKLRLPQAKAKEHEGAYNERAADGRKDLALLDKKNVRCGGAFTPIEVCDLLSDKRQFVHVKHRTSSATLSHLAAQGTVSARAFLEDAAFRKNARAEVRKANKRLLNIIPEERPTPNQYEVVYAIIANPSKDWRKRLPFFTQLHLTNSATYLANRGMKVALHCIGNQG